MAQLQDEPLIAGDFKVSDDHISDDDNKKSCRICYEDDKHKTMIAPCLCSGDLKYVHRKCLDTYRAISISNPAFTTCNTCSFDYIMDVEDDYRCCKSPKTIFRLRVAFDIFKIAFCWFGVVSLIAFILRVSNAKDSIISAYLWGLGITFGIMGIIGIIHGLYTVMSGQSGGNQTSDSDCRCCDGCGGGGFYIWYCPSSGGGGDCNCGNSGGCDGDAGAVCMVILIIVAIILIAIGIIYAVIVSAVLVSQMAARHYMKLEAKLMTREYVVKNLEKYSKEKVKELSEAQKRSQQIQYPVPSAPELDRDVSLINETPRKEHKTITVM